jgi:hypothetical protein
VPDRGALRIAREQGAAAALSTGRSHTDLWHLARAPVITQQIS